MTIVVLCAGSYAAIFALECSRKSILIARVWPLPRHTCAFMMVFVSIEPSPTRLFLILPSPQERLFRERVVVKEIEIFGVFRFQDVGAGAGSDGQRGGALWVARADEIAAARSDGVVRGGGL